MTYNVLVGRTLSLTQSINHTQSLTYLCLFCDRTITVQMCLMWFSRTTRTSVLSVNFKKMPDQILVNIRPYLNAV